MFVATSYININKRLSYIFLKVLYNLGTNKFREIKIYYVVIVTSNINLIFVVEL